MAHLTRRGFLQSSAALTAMAAAPRATAANDTIAVGIIGCRNRGPTVARYMMQAGGFRIATLCDCDERMLAKAMVDKRDVFEEDPPAHERDFRRLLDDPALDAVVVATPDHWHAQMTVMAMDAGKHVFLEKPASYDIDDGKAMVAAQEQHPGLALQVGTQQRSGRHFRDAKAFIDEGGLGQVAFCRASFITDRHRVPVVPDEEPPAELDYDMWVGPAPMRPYNEELLHYNWHFLYDYGTGDMGNWGAHWLDVLRWLLDLDLPDSVAAYGGQYVVEDAKEWPDTQTVLYHYPELTMLWELRHWSRFQPGGGHGGCCEICGEKGSIIIHRAGWTFYPAEGEPVPHEGSDLDLSHVASFADAVRGGGSPSAPIEEGHKSAVLCHLGNITARLNRSIAFDPAEQVIVGDPEAEAFMGRPYRDPWALEDYI